MTKYIFTTILLTMLLHTTQAQTSKWSLQLGVGAASENNLGDSGIRTFGKVSYALKNRWSANAGMGSFQMLRSNEQWEPFFAYNEMRSLSFYHWDLGMGLAIIRSANFKLGVDAGATFRVGRQLNPYLGIYKNGEWIIYYNHEKLNEIGYTLSLDTAFKVTEKWSLGLTLNSHNYNFIGEYLGAAVVATIHL